jgi:hypothetical protein
VKCIYICKIEVIRSKDDTKEKIMDFYYIIKLLYVAFLTSYDFMENSLYSCYYKHM